MISRPHRATKRLLVSIVASVLVGQLGAASTPAAAVCGSPLEPVRRAIEAGGMAGPLAELLYRGSLFGVDPTALSEGKVRATIRLRLPGDAIVAMGSEALCVTVVIDDGERLDTQLERRLPIDRLSAGQGLLFGADIALPDATEGLFLVLQAPTRALWGAVPISQTEDLLPAAGAGATPLPGPGEAWWQAEGSGRSAPPAEARPTRSRGTAVRLIPPRDQPATGRTRIYALVSSPAIDRIVFYLDGEEVATRARQPFYAAVTLDRPARRQEVRAVAFDRLGQPVGEDTIEVNRRDLPFRVRLGALEGDPASGRVGVSIGVDVPSDGELSHVELFLNEARVARFEQPPFRADVDLPPIGPTDFLRAAAVLRDGRTIDDVVLLAAPGATEAVDVNLVDVYAVVTDAEGRPIEGLEAADMRLTVDGRPRTVERVDFAVDVPLVLGLVIDTSGSMFMIMEDTKRAAIRFLSQTIREQDQGFVVDFDEQPRLLQDTTDDVTALVSVLARLHPEGATSMYDAIVFSMLQFERLPGRKALVVLTDGDDVDSRFGPKDCVEYGQRAGVPVYLIGLDGIDQMRRKLRKKELRRITEETGGRLYFVRSIEDLPRTYDEINAELRSQYVLRFYNDRDLTDEERRAVEVEVDRPGARVRAVVGTGPSDP